jgi:hypothetical protein
MDHPTPSEVIFEVDEGHVSVTFKPTGSYSFGRLADPEDIARS